MKFTYSWLSEHLDTKLSPEEIAETLTNIGLEVENFIDFSKTHSHFVVATIKDFKKHPNADRLNLCTVDDGSKQYQVVCGASNVKKDLKGIFAKEGQYIPGIDLKLKKGKIRGETSEGMMLSEKELGLSDEHEGIIELKKDIPNGTDAVQALNLNDPVYEIGITPNRGDCLSVRGIARDLAAKGCGKLIDQKINSIENKSANKSPIEWKIKKDSNSCEFVVGRHFTNVNNTKSPDWLVKRLSSIGLRPINALVDITNFITIDQGRPLHVFDADKIHGDLTIRLAKKDESLEALDNKKYTLSSLNTVISDEKNVLAIAGIIGGTTSGCDESTKNVFLEVAIFNPSMTAKSGRSLNISSDARQRFERGIDKSFVIQGLDYASFLILKYCGGEPSKSTDFGVINHSEKKITYHFKKFEKIIGFIIDYKTQIKYLKSLGFILNNENEKSCTVKVPSWRNDIEAEIDLIEEIVRIHGFEHIKEVKVTTSNEEQTIINQSISNKMHNIYNRLRKILASKDYREVVSFSFHSENNHHDLGGSNVLKVSNAISEDHGYMRNTMIGNHLNIIENNRKKGFENQSIFEIGPIYNDISSQQNIISMMISNNKKFNKVFSNGSFEFYDLTNQISLLFKELNFDIRQFKINRSSSEIFHPGRAAELHQGKKIVARYGSIHPELTQKYTKDLKVFAAEIYLDNLPIEAMSLYKKSKSFESSFPFSEKDFSFIFNKDQNLFEVYKALLAIDKKLIHEVEFFDQFYSKEIGEGNKSIAFRIKIQSKDKTLGEKELDEIYNKVISIITDKFNAQIRN